MKHTADNNERLKEIQAHFRANVYEHFAELYNRKGPEEAEAYLKDMISLGYKYQ